MTTHVTSFVNLKKKKKTCFSAFPTAQIFLHIMDGFTLANCITSCVEKAISFKNIPTVLIGPYFLCETLSIKEFISFRLPSLQPCIKNETLYLSSKSPSMNILSEDGICLLDHPSQLDMKRLIAIFDPDDEHPFISVEIGSHCVPIGILEIW